MGQGDENSVRAFVSKGRPAMGYTVAMDDPMKQPVFTGWMISAACVCLPAAFIVDRKGAIVWMGSTAASTSYSFDEALHDTLSDKPDLNSGTRSAGEHTDELCESACSEASLGMHA